MVLPTPPLPDVTTITLPIDLSCVPSSPVSRAFHPQRTALQPDLNGLAAQVRLHVLSRQVEAVDGDELGLELAAENARRGVAGRAGHGSAAQRAVDMDGAAGDDLRAGCDRADDGDVALREKQRLAGAHRLS